MTLLSIFFILCAEIQKAISASLAHTSYGTHGMGVDVGMGLGLDATRKALFSPSSVLDDFSDMPPLVEDKSGTGEAPMELTGRVGGVAVPGGRSQSQEDTALHKAILVFFLFFVFLFM